AIADSRALDIRSAFRTLQARTLAFYKANPVTTEIWPGTHADHTLRAVNNTDNQANIARIAELIYVFKPDADPDLVRKTAMLVLITTAPVIRYCVTLPDNLTEGILDLHLDQVVFTLSSI
ncbi:MAG: hypothetical protein AAGK23_11970, partial [Pseudomonadota bacterium]